MKEPRSQHSKPLDVTFLSSLKVQAFIKALLYTAVFSQKFSFFVCLVQLLRGVTHW